MGWRLTLGSDVKRSASYSFFSGVVLAACLQVTKKIKAVGFDPS